MKKTLLQILIILSGFLAHLNATVHTVTLSSDNAITPENGSLRYYIENSAKGDTIVFEVEHIILEASLKISYKGLTLLGGEGVVLDGNHSDRVLSVSFDSYNKVILKNLTIQNGYLEAEYSAMGGGMYVFGTGDSENLLVENCTFRNNEVNSMGDGQGGALRTQRGTYINCSFLDNAIIGSGYSHTGGGVMSVGATFINCLFSGNSAKYGGGLYATNGSKVINCTITQNTSSTDGSGAGLSIESESTCINSLLYDNFKGTSQDNVEVYDSSLSYCALEQSNSLVGSSNNIGLSASPFFDAPSGDFRLAEENICINKGNSGLPEITRLDLAGSRRISDGTIDIGAYEFQIPVMFTGTVLYDDGTPIANYTIHEDITTDEYGKFSIALSEDVIENATVFELNEAPEGFTFYPQAFVFDDSKTIHLTAYAGQMVVQDFEPGSIITWDGGTVNVFTTLHLNNSTLSIAPNTRVKFHGHYGIRVTGTGRLLATGTYDAPITFTSGNIDDFVLGAFHSKGSWNKISFTDMSNEADSSRLEFCVLEYSKEVVNYEMGGVLAVDRFDKLAVTNCLFRKNSIVTNISGVENGPIYLNYTSINIVNSIITNNFNGNDNHFGGIFVDRGYFSDTVRIINCNITNNISTLGGAGVGVNSSDGEDRVYIFNSIITGNNRRGDFADQLIGAEINIINSYIEGASSAMFVNNQQMLSSGILFEADAEMTSPHLAENSVCINSGTHEDIEKYLPEIDILGQPRVKQGSIDIGAVEFQQSIVSSISGKVVDEGGVAIGSYELYPGISTNEDGEFVIVAGQNGINNGDEITLHSLDGRYFYPQKIVVGENQIRETNLTVYDHKVVDGFTVFDGNTFWDNVVNVMADVHISDFELYIAPGTTLRFFNNSLLNVSNTGSIVAKGTVNDSITFTSGNSEGYDIYAKSGIGAWSGLRYNNMSSDAPKSIFNYCKIEYAKNIHKKAAITLEWFSNIEFNNCLFRYNSGIRGGVFNSFQSDFTVSNSILTRNGMIKSNDNLNTGGAAFYINSSTVEIVGCEISNNYFHGQYPALYAVTGNVYLINSSFVNNRTALSLAPAVQLYVSDHSSVRAYNSIIWGNANDKSIAQIRVGYATNVKIYNSCLQYGNSFNADVYDDCTEADPLFVDAANLNYQLQSNSPLVNEGLATIPTTYKIQKDLLNNPRRMGESVDMGAYEFNETSLLINAPYEYKVGEPINVEGFVHMGEGSSLSWDFNQDGLEDATGATASYVFDQTGDYIIQLTGQIAGEPGLITVSHIIEIKETITSLPMQVQNSFKVYPNPVEAVLVLEADKVYNIHVNNLGGQKVWQGTMTGTKHSLNTSAWPAGIYFVRFYNQEESFVHKVVKL